MFETSDISSPICADAPCSTGIRLNLAGINIVLTGADADLPLQVVGPMRDFLSTDIAQPDITIRTAWGERGYAASGGELLFDSGSIWRLYSVAGGHYEFRLAAPFSDWQPYKIARFNPDWSEGEILCLRDYFKPDQSIYPLEYPLDEVLISNLLACGRGIEIHGCGLRDSDGRGYLFAGQSGAGKSTTALLWKEQDGVSILSDERVILRRGTDGHTYMHGTPWYGDAKLAANLSARLTKIFFLGRGDSNELVPQGRTDAAARLFACSFPPFYSPKGISSTLEFLDELTDQVDCCELKFVPDERVVQFVRDN